MPTLPDLTYDAVDLFAGPGGWDVAARALGLNVIGIEFDAVACQTRRAAGLPTIEGDVRRFGPGDFFGVPGFIASPPCQTFSMAGNGAGRRALDAVFDGIARLAASGNASEVTFADERTALVLEPLRWMLEAFRIGTPYDWAAFEQVPTVLPVWERMAEVLELIGYSVATGLVYSEQHGVPQTRKRAVLVARLDGDARLPEPTHSLYHIRKPERLDEGVLPWVSMAEALSWGMTERPYPTVAPGTAKGGTDPQAVGGSGARRIIATERAEGRWVDKTWGDAPGAEEPNPHLAHLPEGAMLCPTNLRPHAALRPLDRPAPTMAFGHETPRWVSPEELADYRARVAAEVEPRVNNQSGTAFDLAWPADRPAPTIAGREIVTMPGANANRFNGRTKSRNDGIRVTAQEAAVLQSFPGDYPWQGGKSKVFEQIGNAVPPRLARAILDEAVIRP